MKLRLKRNSIRFRLTKSEVKTLCDTGYVTELIDFGKQQLRYTLDSRTPVTEPIASFVNDNVTVMIPGSLIHNWSDNDIVGFNHEMKLTGTDTLFILIEKDFVCLDETTEDQSDHYQNPNSIC